MRTHLRNRRQRLRDAGLLILTELAPATLTLSSITGSALSKSHKRNTAHPEKLIISLSQVNRIIYVVNKT